MQGVYSNTTTTSPTQTASGCDVNCDINLVSLEYYMWGNGTRAVNQTAVTVIVDVSPDKTQTSTRMDTQMMEDYYLYNYIGACLRCPRTDAHLIFGAEGTISLSKSGTVV
jgi:hypothetical protein